MVEIQCLANPAPGQAAQLLCSLAASDTGARFTPVGGPPMLYFAEDQATTLAEVNQASTLVSGASPQTAAPPSTVMFAATIVLDAVLNLVGAATLSALSITAQQLAAPWRLASARAATGQGPLPLTQLLGQAAFNSGRFQAMLYESVRAPGHRCLTIFTGRVLAPCLVEVHDPSHNLSQRIP